MLLTKIKSIVNTPREGVDIIGDIILLVAGYFAMDKLFAVMSRLVLYIGVGVFQRL